MVFGHQPSNGMNVFLTAYVPTESFIPCKAEPDILIHPDAGNTCYKMVEVYVEDLAIGMKNPEAFQNILKAKYWFKLNDGSGPISFHL
jgi:hypothetical protein